MFDVPQKYALRKTAVEKVFLKNITALEKSYLEENDPTLKRTYEAQITELKARLSSLSGARNNAFVSAEQQKLIFGETPLAPERGEIMLKLCKAILSRYSGLINEREKKTVGEIKALVNKDDLTIQSLAQAFMGENYGFGHNYAEAAEKAFNYVRDEITSLEDIDLGVSFWFTPTEMAIEKIGDDEDKAILLCSLLYALGDENAECIIAELENGTPHAFVVTEYNGKFLLLDPCQGKPFNEFMGQKSEVIKNYSYNGSPIRKFMYRFNNSKYEQF